MKNLVVFLICIVSFLSFGGVITGKVIDENKEVLPFAVVALKNSIDSSLYKMEMTDTLGQYSISATNGSYFLVLQLLSYDLYTSSKFELNESYQMPDIQLKSQLQLLDEVVIKAPEKPIIQKTARGLEVNVANSPVLSSGSTQDALAKVPGVMMNPDGSLLLKGRTGVQIFIDGKRTYMSLEQVMQYLQSLPATDIEKIEVFDIPPAKFDAEGSGGVINIVLKNGAALGTNGMVGMNVGYGKYHKFVPWLTMNHRTKKMNVYASAWYSNSKTYQLYDYQSTIPLDGENTYLESKAERIFNNNGFGGRIGLDYEVNKKNTIGFLAYAHMGEFSSFEPSITNRLGENVTIYNKVDALNERSSPWKGQGYNLNYQRKIKKGEELTIDADFILTGSDASQKAQNKQYWDEQFLVNNITELDNITAMQIVVGKVDYIRNISEKWKLESGLKSSFVNTKNTNNQYIGTDLLPITFDEKKSNSFTYKENIYAGYTTIQGTLTKNIDVDLGLRAEHTFSEGYSPTLDTTTTRNYFNLFPNAAFKYKGIKELDLSFAYARRLNRPNYWRLNPFELQLNQFNYKKGNPYLQPQYASSYSFGTAYKNKLFTTISYTHTSKAMTEVLEQNEQTQLTYHTVINLDDIDNYLSLIHI